MGNTGLVIYFFLGFFKLLEFYLNKIILLSEKNFGIINILNIFNTNISVSGFIFATIGLMGIPIGYIIYQIYFAISRNYSKDLEFNYLDFKINSKDFLDTEKEYLKNLNQIDTNIDKDVKQLGNKSRILYSLKRMLTFITSIIDSIIFIRKRKIISNSKKEIRENELRWALINTIYLKKIMENTNKDYFFENIIKEDYHIADIYHSLGAASFSCFLAFALYFLAGLKDYIMIFINNEFKNSIINFNLKYILVIILSFLLPLIISVFVYYIFHVNRRSCAVQKLLYMYEFSNFNKK